MNGVKREKKVEKVEKIEKSDKRDDSSSSSCDDHKFDEWCDVKKHEGKTHCRRKCKTVCVVECEKEICFKYEFGHKTQHQDKWKPHKPEEVPKCCDKKHDGKKHDDQ